MSVSVALERVRSAPFVLDAMAEADALAAACASSDGPRTVGLLMDAALDPDDQLTAIAAVHGLARVLDEAADEALASLLSNARPFLREHAAWALASRVPRADAVGRLVALVAAGGFPGMVAQRTLQRWARTAGDQVILALEGALVGVVDVAARARLTETVGVVPGRSAGRLLRTLAADRRESVAVRGAAVAAIGDRTGDTDVGDLTLLHDIARLPGELGAVARLACLDATVAGRDAGPGHDGDPGATIAQLFLHADIDPELSRAGVGDNGGIATLLVRLGDALVRTGHVGRVITMSRGAPHAALAAMESAGSGPQWFAPVPLDPDATGMAAAWSSRLAAERGIRRVLRAAGHVTAVHLRMADVGSMAAHAVAVELGIPTVFSLAPDPHGFIHALDMTGALPRDRFGEVDEREHFWFRTRLVRRLADDASHRVLFPRPDLRGELQELLGVDIDDEPGRSTVVPEGIDVEVARSAAGDAARANHPAGSSMDGTTRSLRASGPPRSSIVRHPAIDDLLGLVRRLPPSRQGLPLAVSVGRLHRVKGMATVAEAWASDPELRDRCNLVIVGGDLEQPSADEAAQLERIAAVLQDHPGAADGLVLSGHRPNDVVARWLAVASRGVAPDVAPNGAYVCGSLKEEFGLALLEALAAGLPVVAPHGGGPATYVEPGLTGVLVDTRDPSEVAAGMHAALDLSPVDGRRERAAATVEERFTVDAMAATLTRIYAEVGAVDAVGTTPGHAQRRAGSSMWARS